MVEEQKQIQQEAEEHTKQKFPAPVIESPRHAYVILVISLTRALAQGQNGQYANISVPRQTLDVSVQETSDGIASLREANLISYPLKLQKMVDHPSGSRWNSAHHLLIPKTPCSSLSSNKYDPNTSLTKSNGEMDFNVVIDTSMDMDRDDISNRVEIDDSMDILVEDNPMIDMIVREAAKPIASKSATPQRTLGTPPPLKKTPIASQQGASRSRKMASSSRGDGGNQEEERENEDQLRK